MNKVLKNLKIYFLFLGMFFIFPFIVNAEYIGARSATSSEGDVFLGGNFIEVGISKSGSFGTSSAAPASFHSHALSLYSYKLGLIADGDGWDVGNPPTSGDFFLPGTPYEGYIFKYRMNGIDYRYAISERTNAEWNDPLVEPVVVDQSDISKGKLKALFTVVTKENVKLEMTIEFGVDDIYYSTLVKVTNLSSNTISNVSFTRDLDPDNDKDFNNTYDTYNKVVSNPDPNIEGSNTNFAMVVAVGPVTYNGFFFVSFDNRAKGYISNSAPSSVPTYATDELLQISDENKNGYTLNDVRIQLETKLNDLNLNQSDETVYYSSLDPNVISSISAILKAVSASVKNYTDTRIEVETREGYEYSIDNGEHWQDSGVFEDLEPGKEYVILSRIKATSSSEASEPEPTSITTKNSSPETPDILGLNVTEDSISVQKMDNYEYSIDGGNTWQETPDFNNLEPNTEYEIIARYIETDSTMYGTLTTPIKFKTLERNSSEFYDLNNVDVTFVYDNNSPTIILNKGLLYEHLKEDEDIKSAVENNDNVDIRFVVNAIDLDDDIQKNVDGKLKADENLGFVIDVAIKLYVNDVFNKDITESDENILFKINVPAELIKKGRRFYVLRFHINESGELEIDRLDDLDTDDNTISISSNKFSDYVVTYVDEVVNDKSEEELTTKNVESITSAVTPEKSSNVNNPNTFDNVHYYFILFTIGGILTIWLVLYKKKYY